ncbi:hypothetical protein SEA_ELINAL_67 [Gordonia phage Elinal]|nr:hypothetical protein SEA_ELINAL_67 [Gordonia phage Elinal]
MSQTDYQRTYHSVEQFLQSHDKQKEVSAREMYDFVVNRRGCPDSVYKNVRRAMGIKGRQAVDRTWWFSNPYYDYDWESDLRANLDAWFDRLPYEVVIKHIKEAARIHKKKKTQ